MWIVIALSLLLGLALTAHGLRGRRTDDHPLCRRCRFDLTGRAPDSTRCAECGAELARPRAVVVGHRRRRRGPLLVGILLLVPAIGLGGVLGWGRATQVNWLAYAPLWYLLREASSIDPARRTPALAEVSDRAGRLNGGQWDAVADAAIAYQADGKKPWEAGWGDVLALGAGPARPSDNRWARYVDGLADQATSADPTRRGPALAELTRRTTDSAIDGPTWAHVVATGLEYQGDPAKPWEADWGSLLESAHMAGRLTGDAWQRYVRQAMGPNMFGLRLRPRVRRGDPLPYWLDEKGGRAARSSTLRCRVTDERLAWDGRTPPQPSGGSSTNGFDGGSASGSAVQPGDFPTGLVDGVQHVHLTATAAVYLAAKNGWDIDEKAPPLATRPIDLAGTFELVPADRPTVTVVHDPSRADAIRRAITVGDLSQQAGSYPYVNVTVTAHAPPVDLAFDVVLVQGGREFKAGSVSFAAGVGNSSWGTGGSGLRLPGPTADVILRGDPAVAAATTDLTEVWDGEVVFKDVKVEHP